tara:strand:+ start:2307 stop:2693 length:387 start_codon:yes stop_codon:yes gene_type:complete
VAVTKTDLLSPVGSELFTFTQDDGAPGFVVAQDVISLARKISAVQIDNTTNSVPVYLKIWEANPAPPGVGSVNPEITLQAPASTKIQYTFSPGMNMNQTWVGVTRAAGVTAKSFPTGTVTAKLMMEIP